MGTVAARAGGARELAMGYLERAAEDRTGLRATVAVAVVAALVSVVLWIPLAFPMRALTAAVPVGDCVALTGPLALLCSAKVAVLTLLAPAIVLAAVFVLRKRIADLVKAGAARVPDLARFLVGPSVATALFVLTWANAHDNVTQWGLVPQILFPAVIGIFTWITVRWNVAIQARLAPLFERRDALTRPRRFAIAAAVPVVLGLLLGIDASGFPWKEQILVLVGLASTYVALVPRHGDLIEAIGEAVKR